MLRVLFSRPFFLREVFFCSLERITLSSPAGRCPSLFLLPKETAGFPLADRAGVLGEL